MTTKNEKVIMYDSDEAAQFKTNLSGWVSSNGKYYGSNEHMARWDGSTHNVCECGNVMKKSYIRCETCRAITARNIYNDKPYRKYDSDEPVVTWDGDTYFFSEESLMDFCEEQEVDHIDLLICKPNNYFEVEADYWADIMPEDSDGDLPKALELALANLNEVIRGLQPCSYGPGDIRTTYYYKQEHEDR